MDGAVQYRGVNQSTPRDRKAGRWTAVMTLPATDKEPAKQLTLGTFQTQEDAARQYDKATYIRKRDKARQEGKPLDITSLNLNFPDEMTQEEMDKLEGTSLEQFKAGAPASARSRPVGGVSTPPRSVVEVKDEAEEGPVSVEGKSSGKRVQKKRVVKDLGVRPLKRKASKIIKKVFKPKTRDVGSIKEPIGGKKGRVLDSSQKWKGPSGWKVRVWQRHGEKGGYDMQIVSPDGQVMRSLKQLEEFLNKNGGGDINEFILPYKSPKRLPKKKKSSKAEGKVRKTAKVSTPVPPVAPPVQKKPVRAKALKSPSVSGREAGTSGAAASTPYSCPQGFELQLSDRVVSGNITTEWTITTPEGESLRNRPELTSYLTRTNRTMDGFILPHKGGAREGTRANNKAIGQEPEPPASPTSSKRKLNRRKRKDQGPWVRKVNKKSRHEESSAEEVEPFERDLREQGEDMDQANQAGQKDIMMVDASLQPADKSGIPATSSSSPDMPLINIDPQGPTMTFTSPDSQHGNGLGAILLPPSATVNTRQHAHHHHHHHHPQTSRHLRSVEPILTNSEKEQSAAADAKQDKAAGSMEPALGMGHQGPEGGGVSPHMSGPLTPAPGFKIVSGGAVVPVSGGEGVVIVVKDGMGAGGVGEAAAATAAVERELAMSEVERYNELDASLDEEILRKMQEVSSLAQQQTEVRQKVREQIAKAEMEREVEVMQLRQAEAAHKAEIEAMRMQHAAAMQQMQQELRQERAASLSLQQRLEQELAQERAGGRAHIAELEASLSSLRSERRRFEAEQQALRQMLQAKLAGEKEEMDSEKERAQAEMGELLAVRDRLSEENGRLADERDKLQSLLHIQDKPVGEGALVNGTGDDLIADSSVIKMSE